MDYKQMRNELTDKLADYIFSMMDGDTHMIGDMYATLQSAGYADEYGAPIGDEE